MINIDAITGALKHSNPKIETPESRKRHSDAAIEVSHIVQVLNVYRELHDGLSDMIEDGRLSEADIPDDYQWLVVKLMRLAELDPAI